MRARRGETVRYFSFEEGVPCRKVNLGADWKKSVSKRWFRKASVLKSSLKSLVYHLMRFARRLNGSLESSRPEAAETVDYYFCFAR